MRRLYPPDLGGYQDGVIERSRRLARHARARTASTERADGNESFLSDIVLRLRSEALCAGGRGTHPSSSSLASCGGVVAVQRAEGTSVRGADAAGRSQSAGSAGRTRGGPRVAGLRRDRGQSGLPGGEAGAGRAGTAGPRAPSPGHGPLRSALDAAAPPAAGDAGGRPTPAARGVRAAGWGPDGGVLRERSQPRALTAPAAQAKPPTNTAEKATQAAADVAPPAVPAADAAPPAPGRTPAAGGDGDGAGGPGTGPGGGAPPPRSSGGRCGGPPPPPGDLHQTVTGWPGRLARPPPCPGAAAHRPLPPTHTLHAPAAPPRRFWRSTCNSTRQRSESSSCDPSWRRRAPRTSPRRTR